MHCEVAYDCSGWEEEVVPGLTFLGDKSPHIGSAGLTLMHHQSQTLPNHNPALQKFQQIPCSSNPNFCS